MIPQVVKLYQNLNSLVNAEGFTIEDNYPDFYPSKNIDAAPKAARPIYENLTQSRLRWSKGEIDGYYVDGSINIIPLEQANGDWKDIIWFDYMDADDPLRFFKPVDYFSNETMVGVIDKEGSTEMYCHSLGNEPPQSLGISAIGYLELLSMTRGFFIWQRAILGLRNGIVYPEAEALKKYAPQVFPNFNYDEFVQRYEELKIG